MTTPNQPARDIFEAVFSLIEQRRTAAPEQSYVARLLSGGPAAINAKVLEEAHEVCQAALESDASDPAGRAHLTHEICDLLFHTFVLGVCRGVTLDDLRTEMQRRFGTSGLVEKARRPKP